MPKSDLIRRIDHKPSRSESGLGVYPSNTYGDGTGHVGPYCVGRREGARICMTSTVSGRVGVEFYVRDTANVPFVSFSVLDGAPNSKELHLGYAEKKGIRFTDHTLDFSDVEEHLDLEIDAETLVGVIPSAVLSASGAVTELDDLTDVNAPTPNDNDVLTWDDGASEWVAAAPAASTQYITFTFGYSGTISAGAQPVRLHAIANCTIVNVTATVGTAPTGASIIVDVNIGGTTIFSTQANRPTIAASANDDLSSTPDVTSISQNDVLTFDIDQVGSGTAGADLVVQVRCTV